MMSDATGCLIALGGNLGDVPTTFRRAFAHLAETDVRIVAVSRLFATPPMGATAGGTYLNAAAAVETSLPPLALLDRLLLIEETLGRIRKTHWGPRAIDLDLAIYGDRIIDSPRLRLPHPGCWYRRFVLDPLSDIAPQAEHPETRTTILELRNRLVARPLTVAIAGPEGAAQQLGTTLAEEFSEIILVDPAREPAAIRFMIGSDQSSSVERIVGLSVGEAGLDLARAVLTAALGEPQPLSETL